MKKYLYYMKRKMNKFPGYKCVFKSKLQNLWVFVWDFLLSSFYCRPLLILYLRYRHCCHVVLYLGEGQQESRSWVNILSVGYFGIFQCFSKSSKIMNKQMNEWMDEWIKFLQRIIIIRCVCYRIQINSVSLFCLRYLKNS